MLSSMLSLLPRSLRGLSAKIHLIVLLAIVGLGILAFQASLLSRVDLGRSKTTELKHLVESAMSAVSEYYELSQTGALSEEEARDKAKKALAMLRYDGDNYFWINDMDHKMVMHGAKPEAEGIDYTNSTDPNGLYLFREFVRIGKQSGGGIVKYQWPRPGSDEPMPKLAYVSSFAPWGWIVGTGAYVDDLDAIFWSNLEELLISTGIIFVIITGVSVTLALSITRPMRTSVSKMLDIANGNYNAEITTQDRADEIGDMSRALVVFCDNLREGQQLREQQEAQKAEAETKQKQVLLDMATRFDEAVGSIFTQVRQAAGMLGEETRLLADRAQENSNRVGSISSAMEESSVSVETVASASDQMTASINEIASRVDESSVVARTAVEEVTKATNVISTLSDASQAIGRIVGLIQDIAEQTNLLALNATIEAARAGEAGRGFAVVASEVKELAAQTGKATEEISGQINAIQSNIANAVDAIGSVENTIDQMTTISETIAAAMEEQGVASGEISTNIAMAAAGSREVSDNAEALSSLANENGQSAAMMSQNALELNGQIQDLVGQVDVFLSNIRNQNSDKAA